MFLLPVILCMGYGAVHSGAVNDKTGVLLPSLGALPYSTKRAYLVRHQSREAVATTLPRIAVPDAESILLVEKGMRTRAACRCKAGTMRYVYALQLLSDMCSSR